MKCFEALSSCFLRLLRRVFRRDELRGLVELMSVVVATDGELCMQTHKHKKVITTYKIKQKIWQLLNQHFHPSSHIHTPSIQEFQTMVIHISCMHEHQYIHVHVHVHACMYAVAAIQFCHYWYISVSLWHILTHINLLYMYAHACTCTCTWP